MHLRRALVYKFASHIAALVVFAMFWLQASAEIAVPAINPWLNDSVYPISHHNPAQTDVSIASGPTVGGRLAMADSHTVPVLWSSAPLVKQINGYTTIIAGGPLGLTKIDATGEHFRYVSHLHYPGSDHRPVAESWEIIDRARQRIDERRAKKQDWRLLFESWRFLVSSGLRPDNGASGAYGIVDRDGYHYTGFAKTRLLKSFDDNDIEKPFYVVADVDIRDCLPKEVAADIERIMGYTLTYDGHIAAAATGALLVFDRDLQLKDYLLFPGEHVENSIAADEKRIYVVTSKHMYGVRWDGERLSIDENEGGWISPYQVMPEGEALSMGAASHGSGTTPTLLGFGEGEDKLVVISDGHPEGAQVVAFWRDDIPADFEQKPGTLSRRIADEILVGLSPTTIEASPVIYGDGVLVVNSTYPEPSPLPFDIVGNAMTAGVTREAPKGIQKFVWQHEENAFRADWFLADVDNTDWMPPAVSPDAGLVYIADKRSNNYEYFALDWETGEFVARWSFPDDSVLWNTWGGITTLLEDGDFLLGGFFAVKRFDVGHMRD